MQHPFRQFRYLTPPETPSATFIEDAYRRAVSGALAGLGGAGSED
jgi:hypothetical protein